MATDAWLTLLAAAGAPAAAAWLKALEACGAADTLVASSPRALLALGLPEESVARLKSPDHAARGRARAGRWAARQSHGT